MATKKQIAVAEIDLKTGGKLSKGEAMRRAGYAPSTANKPKQLTESKGWNEIVSLLQKKGLMAAKGITQEKVDKTDAEGCAHVVDVMIKNVQLLTGGDTERSKVLVVPEEFAKRYDIKTNTEENSNSEAKPDSIGQP